jgi:hypothetical protein
MEQPNARRIHSFFFQQIAANGKGLQSGVEDESLSVENAGERRFLTKEI